jgi:hypothetical protein
MQYWGNLGISWEALFTIRMEVISRGRVLHLLKKLLGTTPWPGLKPFRCFNQFPTVYLWHPSTEHLSGTPWFANLTTVSKRCVWIQYM